jgi:hypothetical protein
MMQYIQKHSLPAYEYLFGENGIEANKWRSTEWIKDKTLPPCK